MEQLPRKTNETEEELRSSLLDDMLRLNGHPCVFQMIRFGERMAERGKTAPDAKTMEAEFMRRLQAVALQRQEDVTTGKRPLESILVPGSLPLLDALTQRGLHLTLASGTTEDIVLPEVDRLGLRAYFGENVHAAPLNRNDFSKEKIIENILAKGVDPKNLIAFGDGVVEIRETSRRGGLAVGVASDEMNPNNDKCDPVKARLLIEAGAHLVIPNYNHLTELLKTIFGE